MYPWLQGEWLGEEKVALKLTRGLNHTPKAKKVFTQMRP